VFLKEHNIFFSKKKDEKIKKKKTGDRECSFFRRSKGNPLLILKALTKDS